MCLSGGTKNEIKGYGSLNLLPISDHFYNRALKDLFLMQLGVNYPNDFQDFKNESMHNNDACFIFG